MLEYLLPENVWQPPKLTSEEITEYCKEVTLDGYIERDFLVVFKIEPYIDSILVHINTEKIIKWNIMSVLFFIMDMPGLRKWKNFLKNDA